MSKANWVLIDPESGSGNKSISVSAHEHTGRSPRESNLTFSAANCDDVVRKVIQAGKPEFTQLTETSVSVPKEGKTITISGVSNSSKLTFSLGTGGLSINLPGSYTANSLSIENGTAIQGDPGSLAQFNFSIAINVPANETIDSLSRQVIVTDASGKVATCTLTQTAGDPYLRVQTGDINLTYAGTAVSVSVESNTSWTIE